MGDETMMRLMVGSIASGAPTPFGRRLASGASIHATAASLCTTTVLSVQAPSQAAPQPQSSMEPPGEEVVPQKKRRRRVKSNQLSGIQKQVLKLYRDLFRAAREKSPAGRKSIEDETRDRFRKNLHLSRKDFGHIEHMIRQGEKQLKTVQMKGFDGISRV